MALGEIIGRARAEKGMTQSDLAARLYVTRQAVSRWETGESSPSIDMLKLIAVTLGIPVSRLLELPDQPVCQSCGMVMTSEDCGREADGTPSGYYCSRCFDEGSFVKPGCSLDEQIEASARGLVENLGYSFEEAVSLMGVVLPTLRRWQEIQENERRYGAEVRERYGEDVMDEANKKLLGMPLEDYADLESLSQAINDRLAELVLTGDPESDQAAELCRMHAQWLQRHWPEGAYSKEAHRVLAEGYLADKRFVSYYDNACGKGACEFLVRVLRHHLKD